MDQPRLRSIATTGWRARVRGGVRLALMAALAASIAGLAIETDRPCVDAYHPGVAHVWGAPRRVMEGVTVVPVALLAAMIVGQIVAHRAGLVVASLLGVVAAWTAMNALMALVWNHARWHTITDVQLAAPALLAAAAIGLAQPLVELWLAKAELDQRRGADHVLDLSD